MFRTVPMSIIRSFSLYTQQWYMSHRFPDNLRAGSGRNQFRPDPARELYDIYHCCVYSEKLLMMDTGTVRNMQSFIPKINLRNQCIQLVLLYEQTTMHGHLNVNLGLRIFGYLFGKRLENSSFRAFSRINTRTFSTSVILHTYPPMKMKQSVPKRRHIKFRRRGITQKKTHNIQDTAKVLNQ